jgi:hypothetical protein
VLAKELKEFKLQLIGRIITPSYPVKIFYQSEPYAATLKLITFALKYRGLNHRWKMTAKES